MSSKKPYLLPAQSRCIPRTNGLPFFPTNYVNDNLTVASSGTFSDKNAATGKTVTLANTLTGADFGNYTVTDQTSTTANITPKAITP